MVSGCVENESKRADVANQLRVNPKLKVRKRIDMTTTTTTMKMLVMGVMTVSHLEEENKLRVDEEL